MKIGITSKFSCSFFSNGLNQNLVLLYECLESVGFEVYFLDFTNKSKGEEFNNHFFIKDKNTINWWDFNESDLKFDILLCPGVACNDDIRDSIKERNKNCKIISIKYGNNLFTDSHKLSLSNIPSYYSININRKHDHVLYSPHYKFSKQYLEFTEKCSSSEIPYIWDPKFINHESESLSIDPAFKPNEKPNIAVMEPNLNFSKTTTIPFLALINLIEKGHASKFNEAYIFSNNNNLDFSELSDYLYKDTILKENRNRIFFDPRQKTPAIFNRDNPIILSHQFYNELNYLYLEAIYYNFPLIHNSPPFKDYGYYYQDFNIADATSMILKCIKDQDRWPKTTPDKGLEIIKTYSIESNRHKIKELILSIAND